MPRYRVPFFHRLVDTLADSGTECVVVAGEQREWAAMRGHPQVDADWLRTVPDPRDVSFGSTGPRLYGYGTALHWRDCDALIMPHRGTDIDVNLELIKKRFTGRRIGVWGHLSRSVKKPNPFDLAVERWQMRRADHIFAYTQAGADMAVLGGIPAEKVTAVMNSVDVREVIDVSLKLTDETIENLLERYTLVPGRIFGYIGGLDVAKRVDFISDVLDRLWVIDKDVKFIFAGRGNQQDLLTSAVTRGQAILLGYGGPVEKAVVTRISQALINPGRIGLVAIECLATGIPILTTDWDFHAPEYDYLTPGRDVYSSSNDVDAFARLILGKISDQRMLPKHCSKPYPTIDDMVDNFASGVQEMLR